MHLYDKDWEKARESVDNAEDWKGGREIGLYPSSHTAKMLIARNYEYLRMIEHMKKMSEEHSDYEPVHGDPWVHDLLWCMKGKLHKDQRRRVMSEIVRTDLANSCIY
jgi:hypothetical protein